ncbi:hypothetical protein BFF78_15785 [Streptomyces fodineus]|uniref:Uncharacterized protein n=1 Tax=Streptomyces fodineus TaxID=1904616 RepID=A0A1D7YA25_9ACTN|nr:hypothetical protein [Streptomyces fodineus]AOR32336.1 hypothetical protein BFF78_15785 [Streptomyces fodineus]
MTQTGKEEQVHIPYRYQELAHGERGTVLLADFAGFSARRSLGAALAEGGEGWRVLRVDAVDDLTEAVDGPPPGLPELSAGYARVLRPEITGPAVVVGYCTAASLAGRLAAELALPLVLVQPTWPSADTVAEEFAGIRKEFGADAAATDQDAGFRYGRAGVAEALAAMRTTLLCDFTAIAREQELAEEDAEILLEEMLPRCLAWLGFVRITADDPVRDAATPTLDADDVPVSEVLRAVTAAARNGGS